MSVSSAHAYVQEHYQMPLEPAPASRLKRLKRFVSRCMAHFTSAQNSFNANVVRVLNTLQQQSDDLQARIDTLAGKTDALAGNVETLHDLLQHLHLSRLQGDEIHRNLTAAVEQVQELQQHHGTVIGQVQQRLDGMEPLIGQVQQRLDGMMPLISHCQNVNEQLLNRVRAADQAIADLALRQDDLLACLQRTDRAQQDMTLRQDDLLQSLQFHTARLESELAALRGAVEQSIARQGDMVHAQETLASAHSGIVARQDDSVRMAEELMQQFAEGMRHAGEVGARITRAEEGFVQLRGMVDMLDAHVALLRHGVDQALPPARAPRTGRTQRAALEQLQALWNDAAYQRFEAAQRGSEQDVQARMQWCLDLLAPLETSPGHYILDLGCGRGELLALLEGAGRHARGVDLNKVAVAAARARGLQAACKDMFAALAQTPSEALAAVTAFHLIEHFDYAAITRLLAEVLRVLRPGGLFICETPNALNLRVAASEFYQDPTHVRPVHPALLQHAAHAAGFTSVELRFLHPFPPDEQLQHDLKGAGDAVRANFDTLNTLIFGNRDCACIARKEVPA